MENSDEGFVIEDKREMNHSPNSATFRNNVWPSLKPFLNGCLSAHMTVLQCQFLRWCIKDPMIHVAQQLHGPSFAAEIKKKFHLLRKSMPVAMLNGATYSAARFGSFEILTKKLQAANDGIPLAIYQEACCGLISGAIGACIWYPFFASSRSLGERPSQFVEPLNCRKLFNALFLKARSDGLLALWKGSGSYMTFQMFMTMGMLTSYHRSIGYFRDSISMSKQEAQIGAGIVSAFFAALCGSPCSHVAKIKNIVQANIASGKHSHRDPLIYILEVLKPGGRYKFYSGIFQSFLRYSLFTVVQFNYLEELRDIEESKGF